VQETGGEKRECLAPELACFKLFIRGENLHIIT
jgi:hypothetical protein